MIILIITTLILVACICLNYQLRKERFLSLMPFNFPFKKYGNEYWYSRSVATVLFAFAKNENGETCVLANKRGNGTPDNQGKWNCPCGYLEFDIDGVSNAIKEVWEETGVKIPRESVELIYVDTSPTANRQNVTLRYMTKLSGKTTDYQFSNENMEKDEVSDIAWIPLSEMSNYDWAFNHENIIKELKIN